MPGAAAPRTFSLDQVRIASPCSRCWGDMAPVDPTGQDRVRHCSDCDLNVYNLSNMALDEAEELLRSHEGRRLCAGYYRRADGTILARDCPVGLRALRMKALAGAARIAAALAVLATTTVAMGARRGWWSPRLTELKPFATLRQWVQPGWRPSGPQIFLGGIVCPTPAPPPPAPGN
jgi:hypothetical protein